MNVFDGSLGNIISVAMIQMTIKKCNICEMCYTCAVRVIGSTTRVEFEAVLLMVCLAFSFVPDIITFLYFWCIKIRSTHQNNSWNGAMAPLTQSGWEKHSGKMLQCCRGSIITLLMEWRLFCLDFLSALNPPQSLAYLSCGSSDNSKIQWSRTKWDDQTYYRMSEGPITFSPWCCFFV